MRRSIPIALFAVIALAVTSCGNDDADGADPTGTPPTEVEPTEPTTPDTQRPPDEDPPDTIPEQAFQVEPTGYIETTVGTAQRFVLTGLVDGSPLEGSFHLALFGCDGLEVIGDMVRFTDLDDGHARPESDAYSSPVHFTEIDEMAIDDRTQRAPGAFGPQMERTEASFMLSSDEPACAVAVVWDYDPDEDGLPVDEDGYPRGDHAVAPIEFV